MSQPGPQSAADRYLPISLALALATTLLPLVLPLGWLQPDPTLRLAGTVLFRLSLWTLVLAILAAGRRRLNRDGIALRYLSEAAYLFYILHLPVGTLVTYFAVQIDATIAVKYVLIVFATAAPSLGLYDLLVKRVGALRFMRCPSGKPTPSTAFDHLRPIRSPF